MQLTIYDIHVKTCTQCRETKPLDDYYPSPTSKDGRRPRCRDCTKTIARQWHADNRERSRAAALKWRHDNIEQARSTAIQYRRRNKQRDTELQRQRRQINPDYFKQIYHRRRARINAAVPQRWKRSDCPNHLCYWCGTELVDTMTHVDHIMPIALGGPATPDNEANTCASCNKRKTDKHPLVWIAQLVTP